MTPKQALTQARKRWGKLAHIQSHARGAFMGADGIWRESYQLVCQHHGDTAALKEHDKRKCPREYYVQERHTCEHCKNGTSYTLARMKYHVASYSVGHMTHIGDFSAFHVKGCAESWEAAFRATDPKPKPEPVITAQENIESCIRPRDVIPNIPSSLLSLSARLGG